MYLFLKTAVLVFFAVTTATAGDKVLILDDPSESLNARIELIMTAEKTIDMQYFSIDHDYISVATLAMLRDAAKRGVRIRLLVDSLFNSMTRELMGAFLDNLDAVASKKIEIREFNQFNIFRPLCYTHRMHDKSLIIDGKYLIIGDRNIGNSYYHVPPQLGEKQKPYYRGMDVLLSGSKSTGLASEYFGKRWDSADVKPVRLYEYSSSQLDYSYCNYSTADSDASTCERQRLSAVEKIKKELKKLDQQLNILKLESSDLIFKQPIKKALLTAYETSDFRFIHDDTSTRVCSGKNPENNIAKSLYETIATETKNNLIIVTPYLVITPEMEKLVTYLVQEKNITVQILTNSQVSSDVPSASAAYLRTRHRLLNIKGTGNGFGNVSGNVVGDNFGKVQIYEYTNISTPKLLGGDYQVIRKSKAIDTVHAKVVLIDHQKLFVGSFNWDYRSQNLNSEIGVLIGLTGAKETGPMFDLRGSISHLARHGVLVDGDGATKKAKKDHTELSSQQRDEINRIIADRAEGIQLWQQLLSLPLIGQLLLEQQ